MSHHFFEIPEEGDGIERHLNVHGGRELGPHATHALAGGAFALVTLAFQNENVAATCRRQLIGDAGADDAAADNDYVCR